MKMKQFIKCLIPSLALIFLLSNNLYSVTQEDPSEGKKDEKITEEFKKDELLVKFKKGTPKTDKSLVHIRHGATTIEEFSGLRIHRVKLGEGMSVEQGIASYQNEPDVEYAEPNYRVTVQSFPNDPLFYQLWGLNNTAQTGGTPGADISAPGAWDFTTGNSNVVVAIIDTGVDYTHEDLLANSWLNIGEIPGNGIDDDRNGYVDDVHGINAITGIGDPFDDNGHGTHVAGTVGASGNNSIGVTGINWRIQIIACKFLDRTGSGYDDGAIRCLEYVRNLKNRGVNVVATNNSWGGTGYSQALYDAINAQRDILFMAAAGNATSDNDQTGFYPADYFLPNVIAVAATDYNDNIASFSNYGRRSVSVGAPGAKILSTLPATNYWRITGGYGNLSGTSMATPHVTGLAALIKSQDMTRNWISIRNLVLAGGDDIQSMNGITITGKRINALGSLTCVNSPVFSALEYEFPFTVGIRTILSALSINCSSPVGPVRVTTSSGESMELYDDGITPDLASGDGIFSASWTPSVDTSYLIFSSPAGTERVTAPLRIVTSSLTAGIINIPYSQTLQASGGVRPYTWSVISGSLPLGLTLNGSAGEISGTPTVTNTYTFVVQVTDSESVKVSKSFSISVSGPRPDLIMSSVSAPGTANVGQQITVTSSVKNQGSGGAGGSKVGLYISADQLITTSDTFMGYASVISLAAGAEQTLNSTVTIPVSVNEGTYYVGAIADYSNIVIETDETNNALAGNQITITKLPPDLTITSVSGPVSGGTGQSITATVTVKNQGAALAGRFYVGLYLSSDATITTGDSRPGFVYMSNGLAAGAQQTLTITGTIPTTLASGLYYLGAIADFSNLIIESTKTNNALAGNQITIQ